MKECKVQVQKRVGREEDGLLQLLLGPQVGGVTAGLLAAVGGPGVQAGVALAADHLK